ncbi:MAG: Ig-like domain-containing protein [Chitinophagaceae bacterium]|nr:Ig-like domain-containing protein [Chitinophagaceae bacterium]
MKRQLTKQNKAAKFATQNFLMNSRYFFFSLLFVATIYITATGITGCAQIGSPTGGVRDSIPPVLLKSIPGERGTNFTGNKIELEFNEYIDVQDIQNNVLVSPFPKVNPNISFKLKTITVKLKDTLLANTTYAINFGNAIKDLNEGNPYKNYTYVFSTGNTIDSFTLSGKVLLAESGKTDSTIMAMLYRNVPDSAVEKRKPDYIAKLNREGNFTFTNLSGGNYKVYALKDGDGGKTYNTAIETFAFNNDEIIINDSIKPVILYAYAEEKDVKKPLSSGSGIKPALEKKLKFTAAANPANPQSLLKPLELSFNKPLKNVDEKKIQLTDSSFRKIGITDFYLDSTKRIISLNAKWTEEFDYALIVDKEAVADTTGGQLPKTDTIRFKSKSKTDYGSLLLRFTKYDAAKHPVLQFFKGEEMVRSVPVTGTAWSDKLVEPGEYELRILYDENNNGKWDPGNYKKKLQPEKAVTLSKKLSIRANWDNERDIEL